MLTRIRIGKRLGTPALCLALAAATTGCGSSEPVGGLTNPNPGSVVDSDKPATRTDLPVPDLNAAGKEPVAESAATSPAGTGTTAGTGGPGGGQPGKDSGTAQSPPDATSPANGTPPAKDNAGDASGGTKPAGPIKAGTPKGPQ